MPKDNRNRHHSHYSYSSRNTERDRDRSPRDRDRSPNYSRDRERQREYYRNSPPRRGYQSSGYPTPHPYSSSYPQASYMSDQRRTFARGQGGQRQPPQQQQYSQHPRETEERPSPSTSAWTARGGPQPGYSRQASQPSTAGSSSGGRANLRLGTRSDDPAALTSEEGKSEGKTVGRGNWRGGRILPAELLVTRDKELKSKKGVTGKAVQLQANYYKLLSRTDWCLYQYAVKFEPEEDKSSTRKGLLRTKKDDLKAYIFDGSILYSSNRYSDSLEFFVKRKSDDKDIKITIKFTKEISKSDYQYLQFFNIIMRKCYEQLKLQLIGRNYFDVGNRYLVQEFGLELWPGYVTSIRQHERDILMCAEITHKVMRQNNLLDTLNQIYHQDKYNFRDKYMNAVIGLVVITDYNNNTYRISDVDFDVTPLSTFKKKDGTEVTYKKYYMEKYQIAVREENQPMLVTQSKPKDRRGGQADFVYLVPELCRATGITEQMKNDRNLMNGLAEHTRVSPSVRIQKLLAFNARLHSNKEIVEEFKRWNLELDRNLVEISARILEDEMIYIGKSKEIKPINANWTKELRSHDMFTQCPLRQWFIVYPRFASQDINKFIGCLIKVGQGFRLQIDPPIQIELREDKASDYTNEIEKIMSRQTPQLICCIAANVRADRYSAIKKKCAVDRPVPSQVILAKNLKKGMSIATKVCIQLNCKLGGAPWTVKIPMEGLMVVGYDVCHDTNNKDHDFGAMVASLDRYCTRYYSTVSAHRSGEELSNFFAINLVKALRKYEEINKNRPNRIVIYRDGVGEGDVAYVVEHEIAAITRALNEAYGDPNLVKYAFILVTKRINTRFFYNRSNPPPGTVVDDVVTNPLKYDFFLISQHVTEGTVTPTAYSVLFSNCGLAPDKLQRLTYKLTHMYYNWCGTVRVPAPCQYAHKLAFLVAQAIHRPPDAALESILHFL